MPIVYLFGVNGLIWLPTRGGWIVDLLYIGGIVVPVGELAVQDLCVRRQSVGKNGVRLKFNLTH